MWKHMFRGIDSESFRNQDMKIQRDTIWVPSGEQIRGQVHQFESDSAKQLCLTLLFCFRLKTMILGLDSTETLWLSLCEAVWARKSAFLRSFTRLKIGWKRAPIAPASLATLSKFWVAGDLAGRKTSSFLVIIFGSPTPYEKDRVVFRLRGWREQANQYEFSDSVPMWSICRQSPDIRTLRAAVCAIVAVSFSCLPSLVEQRWPLSI